MRTRSVEEIGQTGGRRFLLAGAVSRYPYHPAWNRKGRLDELNQIVDVFTKDLGYEHVHVIGQDPTRQQIEDALRDFCMAPERSPNDYVALYLAGHAETANTGDEYLLLPADGVARDLRRRAIRSTNLAEWMLAETRVCRLLIMIDTSFSGQARVDFERAATIWRGDTESSGVLGTPKESGVVVVSATRPRERITPGAFSAGFARAVRKLANDSQPIRSLAIDSVIDAINAAQSTPVTQQAQWSFLAGSGRIPNFLPMLDRDNEAYSPGFVDGTRRHFSEPVSDQHWMEKSSKPVGHVFISYVREDARRVEELEGVLVAAGIPVWRDATDLWPGQDWQTMIRKTITDNSLVFIACFSRQSLVRSKSYQNEELNLAIEQLRLRRPEEAWLIPVRFDDCAIPDLDIGGGRVLSSIQRVDLFGSRSVEESRRLIEGVLRILGQ
ncbi:MAG TPA: TIR domain-containing protein [Candidatus Angelobacter sp.]|jgi:hypothetical protein|nr:TIR domain-containing protein [Candidatus Angelobacter sp.]